MQALFYDYDFNLILNLILGIVECYDFKTKMWSTRQESQNQLVYPSAIWEHVCQQLFVPKLKEDDL